MRRASCSLRAPGTEMAERAALQRYEDLTADWLTDALQARWPGCRVAALEHGPIFGYKRNKFRVRAEYAGDAPRPDVDRFIVKGNFPGENDPATGSAWAMASELRSIRDIAPLVAAPAMPESFRVAISPEASDIIMADLTPGGTIFFHAFRTLSLGQAIAFVDSFARMHASSWGCAEFPADGSTEAARCAEGNRRMLHDHYFPGFFHAESWDRYVDLPRGRALPHAFQSLPRMQAAWTAMWDVLHQATRVIVHGDEHLGNLYVEADGTPGVIDWVARPEAWPIGIVYFLLCALDIEDRRRWERPLLDHYVNRLSAYGVQHPPTAEVAWLLYRCACLYPVITWLNNSATWQPESINTANAVRASTAALDHGSLALLGV